MAPSTVSEFALDPPGIERLANLAGPFDGHLRMIELRTGVEIANRGNIFRLTGAKAAVRTAEKVLRELWREAGDDTLDEHAIHLALSGSDASQVADADVEPQEVVIRVKRGTIRGRGPNQQKYLHAIATNDINFGIGPAGTGKTFLAVASAVEALNESRVQRLVLAPLAYMRGRTLNDAYVILDEAQNTTIEQMKMFLTRIGYGSTAVVTGDLTQNDLPKHVKSGLKDAVDVLREVDEVSFTFFESHDVVRHPLVARIVNAYEARDAREAGDAGIP